jgi:glycosyltransferase involved in cell wall biosynthesis
MRFFDTILCSTFVDVGMLKGLLWGITGWNRKAKILMYFHENQFGYPGRVPDPSGFQFTAINFNSALVSDAICFNSSYNYDNFIAGCRKYVKKAADMKLNWTVDTLEKKSIILAPPLDFSGIDAIERKKKRGVPVIVWNHRWEHDKNPEEFFQTLGELDARGIEFRLIVLGESFRFTPDCFSIARERLNDKIIHWGYADSYREYVSLLKEADIVVSTAFHEFFGIAVMEAVRAGCYPLLPDRLSYPELFEKHFLYGEGELVNRLQDVIRTGKSLSDSEIHRMTDRMSWNVMKKKYRSWLVTGTGREE